MEKINGFTVMTQFEESDEVYSSDTRLFDLNTLFGEELLTVNIIDAFDNRNTNSTNNTNFISVLLNEYNTAMNNIKYTFDEELVNGIVYRITTVFISKLEECFNVTIPNTLDSGNVSDMNDYLNKLVTLYEFFICRRFENISDYLIRKIFNNKEVICEKYKNALTTKDATDLFYNINKKKYKNQNDAVFLYFIDDIISDILIETTDGFELFKYIVNIDVYESINNEMLKILDDYGYSISFVDGVSNAAKKYLNIISNRQLYIELRNNIFLKYTEQSQIKNNDIPFTKNSTFTKDLNNQTQQQNIDVSISDSIDLNDEVK